jgi:hypothetical protein
MHDFIRPFSNRLIDGQIGVDALKNEIAHKCDELNVKYPKTKPMEIHCFEDYEHITVRTSFEADVFRMSILKVRGTYRFAEKALPEEAGITLETGNAIIK